MTTLLMMAAGFLLATGVGFFIHAWRCHTLDKHVDSALMVASHDRPRLHPALLLPRCTKCHCTFEGPVVEHACPDGF